MARIFLDANKIIHTADKHGVQLADHYKSHALVASPLSMHILCYLSKKKLPDLKLEKFVAQLHLEAIDQEMTDQALQGPTDDFEDNIQLHSAARAKCEYFLTNDQELLKLKFFGEAAIVSEVPPKTDN